MRKVYGFLTVLFIAMLFPMVANAEASFDMECSPLEAERNSDVSCTIKIASTDGTPIDNVSATVTVPTQMTYEGVYSANTGWTDVSSGTSLKFNYHGGAAITSASDIATFKVKVAADATECGDVCIETLTYNDGANVGIATPLCQTIRLKDTTPTIPDTTIPDTTYPSTSEENPQTGSFVPYVVISGAALLAIGAIVVATKKSKFYNI